MELKINGKIHNVDVEGNMPLLWVLRDELKMTGTKYGCGVASCGSCTVHVDGKGTRSCLTPVSSVEGKEITTIEGISQGGELSAVQKAWIEHQVPQCGYCQSGMIMAAEQLLNENPDPTEEDIRNTINNICRCGTYNRVIPAVQSAAKNRKNPDELLGSIEKPTSDQQM